MDRCKLTRIDADIIIPARFSSTRFPGKPLVRISGTPMVHRVVNICSQVVDSDRIWVATDDRKIADYCAENGIQFVMTSPNCLTGTDRVAEANLTVKSDLVINVQGDEPCISPSDIVAAYQAKLSNTTHVINGYCEYENSSELLETNVPKVVFNESGKLIYISRESIPHTYKRNSLVRDMQFRQVCIYAFDKNDLSYFFQFGRRSALESKEDIEILRFFELDIPVEMVKMSHSLAVDLPDDVLKVENFLRERNTEDKNNLAKRSI